MSKSVFGQRAYLCVSQAFLLKLLHCYIQQ